MSETTFLVLLGVLGIGMCLLIIGEAFLFYINRSNLYSQERFDAAFRQIVKREKKLEKLRARNERFRETVDGI